ncbi:NAD(P)/FAD-dependent oxidoreductase [Catenuloplanes japonicus]|uniref:NAD(P)/FAD-dependent oxidoreductase n=1 Tax=Catenuloplanes japonicus TaxID=33876 RepID=UPI0005273545|nr:FAD-dependent oxidoreductase [Catenuloplanes japonicus]
MSVPGHVVIVGASAGGLTTLEALRRLGHDGAVTVIGDEIHPPYDRPPLSKQVLSGAWHPDRAALRTAEAIGLLGADLRLGERAVALDSATRTVTTSGGMSVRGDAIVIATGATPRRLPGSEGVAGVHVLRGLDDTLRLREDLEPGRRLVVVGDGVLGSEIAATAVGLGVDTTLVGPQAAPMRLQLGDEVSALLGQLHTDQGVRLRLGTAVDGLVVSEGRASGVRLTTGEVLPADVVVIAFGAAPATDWLAGSGLYLDNGVVCDSRCLAADGVWAVGDVARFHHEHLRRSIRLENRTNATEQAMLVAANILGADRAYTPVPYFWTDQFHVKIQVYGTPTPEMRFGVVDGSPESGRFVGVYHLGDRPAAVLGWNMPKQARQHRQLLLPVPVPPKG